MLFRGFDYRKDFGTANVGAGSKDVVVALVVALGVCTPNPLILHSQPHNRTLTHTPGHESVEANSRGKGAEPDQSSETRAVSCVPGPANVQAFSKQARERVKMGARVWIHWWVHMRDCEGLLTRVTAWLLIKIGSCGAG